MSNLTQCQCNLITTSCKCVNFRRMWKREWSQGKS